MSSSRSRTSRRRRTPYIRCQRQRSWLVWRPPSHAQTRLDPRCRALANGNIRLRTTSQEARSVLAGDPSVWLPALADGAQLARHLLEVEVRVVSTNPSEPRHLSGQHWRLPLALLRRFRPLASRHQTGQAVLVARRRPRRHAGRQSAFNRAVYSGLSVRGLCATSHRTSHHRHGASSARAGAIPSMPARVRTRAKPSSALVC